MSSELIIKLDAQGEGEVIEYSVAIGDSVSEGDSLLVVESDKASMDIPATSSGVVTQWLVEIGSNVSQGAELAMISAAVTAKSEIAFISENVARADIQQLPTQESNSPVTSSEIIISLDAEGAGEVVEYSAAIGDSLSEGQALLLVESDKAAMDIPSNSAGVLTKWLVEIGDQVSQGQQLAIVTVTAEQEPIATGTTAEAAPAAVATEITNIVVKPQKKAVIAATTPLEKTLTITNGSTSAGPAARKLAREMAVDLSRVTGSSYRGRILKEDVKAYVKQQMLNAPGNTAVNVPAGSAIAPFDEIDFSKFGNIETKSMSGMARATSAHMTRCWLNIPHVTLSDEVDITELEAFRGSFKPEEFGLQKKPTILPFIIMIIAKALRKFPQFNCSIHPDGQQIIYKQYINIGIAVDTPAGLLVPVIKDADKKSISELAQQINTLAERAKNRKLSGDEMSGGCFSISSLGPIGGTGFTPIINGPEVAILGVASAEMKPVYNGESFVARKKLPLCLSFDHRVINGADAGKFMAMVRQHMEQVGKIIL